MYSLFHFVYVCGVSVCVPASPLHHTCSPTFSLSPPGVFTALTAHRRRILQSMYSNMLFCNWSYSSQLAEFDFEKGEASMCVCKRRRPREAGGRCSSSSAALTAPCLPHALSSGVCRCRRSCF